MPDYGSAETLRLVQAVTHLLPTDSWLQLYQGLSVVVNNESRYDFIHFDYF